MLVTVDPAELLSQEVTRALDAGPASAAALIQRLDRLGLLAHLRGDGIDDDDLEDALLDDLIVTDKIWVTRSNVLALAAHLTDGMVLTHRLTSAELDAGKVQLTPDLVVLDWAAPHGLGLPGGGRLTKGDDMVNRPGEDHSTLSGPEGWLQGFATGDILAFTRTGESVRIERVEDLVDDGREVEVLEAAVDDRLATEESEEAVPLILDALTFEPTAFRRPVRPLGELLESAGLTRRGFSFGRRGENWRTHHEQYHEHIEDFARHRVALHWRLGRCCALAMDTVCEAYEQGTSETARDGLDGPAVADALRHGTVAPAFAEFVLDGEGSQDNHLSEFAAWVGGADRRHTGAPRLLVALEANNAGQLALAEECLRDARRDDPGYRPVASELARFDLDRGDIGGAEALLHHSDLHRDESLLGFLREHQHMVAAPYRGIGRNDRCPCGSGQKFKYCHLRNPDVPLSARTGLLMCKLDLFAERDLPRALMVGVAASACDPDDPELLASIALMVRHPLIVDFAIFEGGIADEYLDRRGYLLPSDERELVEQALDTPRRLWQITAVDPGEGFTLRDVARGDVVGVTERAASVGQSAEDLMLARVVQLPDQSQIMGSPMRVPSAMSRSARELVESGPDADALAAWFGKVT